jgi:hypothetical protein
VQIFKARISLPYVVLNVALLGTLSGLAVGMMVAGGAKVHPLPLLVIAAGGLLTFSWYLFDRTYVISDDCLEVRYGSLRLKIDPRRIREIVSADRPNTNPLDPMPRDRIRIDFAEPSGESGEVLRKVFVAPSDPVAFIKALERVRHAVA